MKRAQMRPLCHEGRALKAKRRKKTRKRKNIFSTVFGATVESLGSRIREEQRRRE